MLVTVSLAYALIAKKRIPRFSIIAIPRAPHTARSLSNYRMLVEFDSRALVYPL